MPMPMMNRQTTRAAMMFTPCACPARACPNEATMMSIISMPSVQQRAFVQLAHSLCGCGCGCRERSVHMRFRPKTSASQPKISCPKTVPTGVATLTPRSWFALNF